MMASSSTCMARVQVHCRVISRGIRLQQHRQYGHSLGSCSYSRMLDMGGAPGATAKHKVRPRNTSKNSKVQAVAFDFELLVKAIHEQEDETSSTKTKITSGSNSGAPPIFSIKPNVDKVKEMANLLKVDLGQSDPLGNKVGSQSYADDDLSTLLGSDTKEPFARVTAQKKTKSGLPSSLEDIRSKYADKLHKKGVEGGIAGVELANYQREEAQKRGDAGGHWAARKIAAATSTQEAGTRWMALTGTGKLLSTLTHRSMKIALLPRSNSQHSSQGRSPYERMEDLKNQLKDVLIDVLIDLPPATASPEDSAKSMVNTTLEKLALDPQLILFVSDQDHLLREAKELGMVTCRIRPLNARRGNVSAHYTVESVWQVENVVNEMNGISFNVVLNM